jgi:hypothetical protein
MYLIKVNISYWLAVLQQPNKIILVEGTNKRYLTNVADLCAHYENGRLIIGSYPN